MQNKMKSHSSSDIFERNVSEILGNLQYRRQCILNLLSQDPVDLVLLKSISRLPGGFLDNDIRDQVWPKLVGVNRYQCVDFREFIINHAETNQVDIDIER
jgi:hypothetical protein